MNIDDQIKQLETESELLKKLSEAYPNLDTKEKLLVKKQIIKQTIKIKKVLNTLNL